MIILYTNFIQR